MLEGKWYPEGSPVSYVARLIIVNETEYRITIANGMTYQDKVKGLQVANRLGNVERKIILQDGSVFATDDNDTVDEIFKNKFKTNSLIHTLESHMGWIVMALVVTVFATFSFFKWGVPYVSKSIAHALPHKTNQLIAANTLDFLDKFMFEKTKHSNKKIREIRTHFKKQLVPLSIEDKDIKYTLHFRKWNDGETSIPNALALPSGDIILTDKFVELCKTQDEMDSVILHEMGHVVHRHTLEMVIEATFVSVAVMMIAGDSNGLADMGVGLGSLLVSSAYSRGHESEADMYAFTHMLKAGIDPASFSRIMNRISSYMETGTVTKKKKNTHETKSKESVLDYLSSHPSTKRRVEIANAYSECYKKGLTTCVIKVSK